MSLRGIKVLELAGLAPAPFCGMVLSDFGANVIRVDKVGQQMDVDRLSRGKKSIAINLKRPEGVEILRTLCQHTDVLIEPFRKGVMEKLNLGPQTLHQDNPKLIYARLTGFGQSGVYAARAGHDINYLAVSGVLSMLGRHKENPFPPLNLLGDFAAGGMLCAMGIVMALLERTWSGRGQVIDSNIVEGSAYLGSWLWNSRDLPVWGHPKGKNMLDSGAHFYDTYRTKDDKFMAVGAIEPKFYSNLLKGLGLKEDELAHYPSPAGATEKLAGIFAEKTQAEWCDIFDKVDACVTPVLELDEAPNHPHNKTRGTFMQGPKGEAIPRPAPLFQRSMKPNMTVPVVGQHTREVLVANGLSTHDIDDLIDGNVVEETKIRHKL